jgi:hypothetical protein
MKLDFYHALLSPSPYTSRPHISIDIGATHIVVQASSLHRAGKKPAPQGGWTAK